MENDNNSNDENLLNFDFNESNINKYQEKEQKESNIEKMEKQNISNNEMKAEISQNDHSSKTENEEEQIIIENKDKDLREDNIKEKINRDNEKNININNKEHINEKELYNEENEGQLEEIEERYGTTSPIEKKNKHINIEEYDPELKEKIIENNEEYILNTLAKLKKNNKLKIKDKSTTNESGNKFSNTEDKIVQTDLEKIEPINIRNKKMIFIKPIINSCKIEKKDNIFLESFELSNIQDNYKYGINGEGNPIIITDANKNEIIAYIVLKNNEKGKNYLIDTKGNIIPKTEEGNYIYIQNNINDNTNKSILIKDFDVQNPVLRTNAHNINGSVNSEEINNNNKESKLLRRNIYNKSNDDIKRILNLDNNNSTPDNLLNYNNLMDIWRQRYGKKNQLYKKLNDEFESSYKNENSNKMVKRTNSILKMTEKNYISSFTDNNTDSNLLNNNFANRKRYRIPIYFNGIINRKVSNPLLKKYNIISNNNRYNPLLKNRTKKIVFMRKNNNFTDLLRNRFNNSEDSNKTNYNQNISFEKLNFKRNDDKNKILYINNRYNYKGNCILKNNLYKSILEKNREKEFSQSNEINNKGNKKNSIINNNIFNAIIEINNKNRKQFKYSVLNRKANLLIKSFNDEFKKKQKFIKE